MKRGLTHSTLPTMRTFFFTALGALCLTACQTTERATDQAAEGVEDGADAVATVARGAADTAEDAAQAVAGAVTDAAGTAWDATTDVFEDDPSVDAVALVRPTTAPGAQAQGTVRFMYEGDALMAQVSLSGLSPGAHGLHIHENPTCGPADSDGDGTPDPAGAAGGHWDPLGTEDHGAPTEEDEDKHIGDLGNVTASSDGTVEVTLTVEDFNPSTYPVSGHAIVIHGGRDDLETDPAGESGTPQGCGEIEARM